MNFAKTKSKTIKKSFDYKYTDADGKEAAETIEIEFYAKSLTPAFLDSLMQYEERKDSHAIAQHIAKNLVGWNLTWNDEAFPPTVENLTEVCDFDFLMQIVTAMTETFGGNEPKPAKSQSLSAVSEQSETETIN
jgi:hypothetical protein